MTDIYVYTDEPIKILSKEKRWINKYSQSWVFVTEEGEFTINDDIKYIYQCNDCGVLSKPIKNHKKILKENGERLCTSCCKKGERNGFYGKTHTEDTINQIKSTASEISKRHWQDPEYRKRVIDGVSKPRREGFGKEQSERITQWYEDNPEQRNIRSEQMKMSWDDGKITPNPQSTNRSKGEIGLYEYLTERLDVSVEEKKTLRMDDTWFLPDIVIDDTIIIEYFGDYWHGNPLKYDENDIIGHKIKAGDIWSRDKKRIDTLVENGYSVIIVWQSDSYESCIPQIERILDEKRIQKPS